MAALACGFDAVGVCRAEVMHPERERYLQWLGEHRNGDMAWLTEDWAERASEPDSLLSRARSVVCVALSYAGRPAEVAGPNRGRIARYANGRDYHMMMREQLRALAEELARMGGATRPFVDTAPTMDKALAVRAGLGWQGRNTNVLSRELGSFTILGGLITDLDLEPTTRHDGGCGSCRLCVTACPTGALQGDYTIDARLCISYLTIEHRGPIPRELRPLIGDWVFGCDICQDVCPPVTDIQDREFPEARPERIDMIRSLLRRASDAARTGPSSAG